jgi:nitroreductase
MEYDSLLELVKVRRSIRRFKPDPIPDEHVDKIIEVARWAPSGFNMQPWEFVVVKKPDLRKKITELFEGRETQMKAMEATREPWQGPPWKLTGLRAAMDFTTAPVFIILFGDPRTSAGLPMNIKYDPHRLNFLHCQPRERLYVHAFSRYYTRFSLSMGFRCSNALSPMHDKKSFGDTV